MDFWYGLLGLSIVYSTAGISVWGAKDVNWNSPVYGPRPFFQPPDWFFGVIWPILYTLEGLALAPLLKDKQWIYIAMFCINLILSAAWTWVFCKNKALEWGLVILEATFSISVILLCFLIWDYYILSASLFAPYIIWITVATLDNGARVYPELI